VFVVGSRLSRMIARYEPYKLEKGSDASSYREARRTKASNEEKKRLLNSSALQLQGTVSTRGDGERASDRTGENEAKARQERTRKPLNY